MKLILEFDFDADVIEVPQYVLENREVLRKRFLKWLYSGQTRHKYWVTVRDVDGKKFRGVKYRSDAFVEWLNKKVLMDGMEKASILEEHVHEYAEDIPKLVF